MKFSRSFGDGSISHHSQPTGPGCQRKTTCCVHTNDPVNLGSGPEFWLQFAKCCRIRKNHCGKSFVQIFTVVLTKSQVLRWCSSQNEDPPVGWIHTRSSSAKRAAGACGRIGRMPCLSLTDLLVAGGAGGVAASGHQARRPW